MNPKDMAQNQHYGLTYVNITCVFYLLVLSQVNDRVLFQTKKVKKSKGISASCICEWGSTLADVETAYYYQMDFDRYFAGVSNTVLPYFLHGADAASDTYD